MKNITARLTVDEKLFLHCLSGSRREAAFLQPLCVKHTSVLVGPYNGHLCRDKKLTDPKMAKWFSSFSMFPPQCFVVISH